MNKNVLQWLDDKNSLSEEEKIVVFYGMNQIILWFINIVSFLAIGLILKCFTEAVLLLLFFIPLRRYAGGYHANTKKGCFLLSNVLFAVMCWSYINIRLPILAINTSTTVFCIIIYLLTPVENAHNRLTDSQQVAYRRKVKNVLIIEWLLCVTTYIAGMINFTWLIECVLFLVLFLQLLGIAKNRYQVK